MTPDPLLSASPAAESTRRAIVVCDQWLGSDAYAGMRALRRAGWNVLTLPEWEFVPVRWRTFAMRALGRITRPAAVREYNAELLRLARRFRPEMLLVFKGPFVQGETLRALREEGIRTYCFYPDVSFRAHGPWIPGALPQYDWIFTTKSFGIDDMREQLGVTRSSLIMFAADPELHRPVELTRADHARFDCDVSYIGTWSPKKEQLLGELIRRRPDLRVRIWGEQWNKAVHPSVGGAVGGHEVIGEDFVRAICGSRINLSIMSEKRVGSSKGDQVASRTFAVPACGAFVIHERTDEVRALFREGEEIACFDGLDEMVDQIDRYLADDERRAAIAEAGRRVVMERHSWDQRIREIIDHHLASIGAADAASAAEAGVPAVHR
jgi:hypothetical protein